MTGVQTCALPILKINGNLYIMEGVNDGDVDLDHVKINGKLFVRGGGKNSIHINNCEINELVSTKDKVRIVLANGTTMIEIGRASCRERV